VVQEVPVLAVRRNLRYRYRQTLVRRHLRPLPSMDQLVQTLHLELEEGERRHHLLSRLMPVLGEQVRRRQCILIIRRQDKWRQINLNIHTISTSNKTTLTGRALSPTQSDRWEPFRNRRAVVVLLLRLH
jgi:hypothetical protein